ncbi:MAG: YlxR family protein, partial [Deltaproteobacteria bacterium]|nr:YlxR family protein [Deltaproteobacteria bacterium]
MNKTMNLKAFQEDGPVRTCVGCRRKRPMNQLTRLALCGQPSGNLAVVKDPGRKLFGRGAWVCADQNSCLEKASKKGQLQRALRVKQL